MDSPYYLGGGSSVNFAPSTNSAMKLATNGAGMNALKSYLMGLATKGKSSAPAGTVTSGGSSYSPDSSPGVAGAMAADNGGYGSYAASSPASQLKNNSSY